MAPRGSPSMGEAGRGPDRCTHSLCLPVPLILPSLLWRVSYICFPRCLWKQTLRAPEVSGPEAGPTVMMSIMDI